MSPSYCFCGIEEVLRNLYLCATPILLQLHGSSPQYKERNVVRILDGLGILLDGLGILLLTQLISPYTLLVPIWDLPFRIHILHD